MWKPLSLNEALRAFSSGQKVMVADFTAGKCLPLSEVLRRFEEGVLFGVEASEPLTDAVRGTVTIEENGDIRITRARPVNTVHGLVEDCTAPDPEQTPPKPKKAHTKKMVEETEMEYQTRKIDDLGKLRSLRAAGWPVKKIAEEFRCSEATVYNTLKKLEAEA